MNRLLSANFARIRKDKVFWMSMVLMFVFGAYTVVQQYMNMKRGYEVSMDNLFFDYIPVIGVFASVFCSLYIGTEYSDGTIRNKLVVGHERIWIYLSNLIACTVAEILMCFSYMAAVCVSGIPLVGFFQTDIRVMLVLILSSMAVIVSFSAIFTMISMLGQNKAMAAIINIIGFFAMFFIVTYIFSKLLEPAVYDSYLYTDSLGNVVSSGEMPNPNYLQGMKRSVYEFFYDFLPMGQAMQIYNMSADHLGRLALYSLSITVATTLGGAFGFGKKDIK